MIRSFRHKGLAELFEQGHSRRVRPDLQARCLRRLEALDQAESLAELNVPGFAFHGLHGLPERYSIHVNGPGLWLRMQQNYDLWYTERSLKAELEKIEPVEA